MDIDFWGVVHGTQAFLPHLAASGDGQLANVSSVFGLIAVPKQAPTTPRSSRCAASPRRCARNCSWTARRSPSAAIHPGGVRTEIARRARATVGEDKAEMARSFDAVARTSPAGAARTILKGLERDRGRILVGPDAWLLAGLPRALGAHYGKVVARGVARLDR